MTELRHGILGLSDWAALWYDDGEFVGLLMNKEDE